MRMENRRLEYYARGSEKVRVLGGDRGSVENREGQTRRNRSWRREIFETNKKAEPSRRMSYGLESPGHRAKECAGVRARVEARGLRSKRREKWRIGICGSLCGSSRRKGSCGAFARKWTRCWRFRKSCSGCAVRRRAQAASLQGDRQRQGGRFCRMWRCCLRTRKARACPC